jgi:aldose 1-epimerase
MHAFLRRRRSLSVVAPAIAILAVGAVASASAGHRHGGLSGESPSVTSEPWGTSNGQQVNLYTLNNGRGMTVAITNYGGVVQSINVPDRNGKVADVALGFPNLAGYVNDNTTTTATGETYFGGIIGRYANRIANGEFTLNGVTYHLPQNNGTNTLHGGPNSWHTKVWAAAPFTAGHNVGLKLTYTDRPARTDSPGPTATVTYTSPTTTRCGSTTSRPRMRRR